MRIVIPTFGRVDRQTTLMALPTEFRREALLVTSNTSEAEAVRRNYELKKIQVRVAPVATIADKRQWILENVKEDVFMLDDDMVFYRRCAPQHRTFVGGRWKPKSGYKGLSLDYVTDPGLFELFEYLEEKLDRGFPAIGISSRFGNDLEGSEWKYGANRLMHGFGYDRKLLRGLKFQFNAVQFREDMHMALTLLRAGYESAQCYEWCVAPGAYGAPGGCTDERTVAKSDAAAEQLATLHPGFVRVVQKDYKGTPRKEVVVSWKRALTSGQQ
jgi:hypothetical protein